jgi:Uncharacterized protein conserved in bacteria (DUF2059)
MLRAFVLGVCLMMTTPGHAQSASKPIAASGDIDPARLNAAKPVIEKLWPLGTYRRMMDGTMSKMMDAMLEMSFGMKASDVDPTLGSKKGETTVGDMATDADPHFRERMRIGMDVMLREILPLMEKVEPVVRDNLTRVYARDFTVEQLDDMNRFLSTPTGQAYGKQWMMTFSDPEMIKSMQSFAPELIKAMPKIVKKVEKATAHLPKPPKPKAPEAEVSDDSEDVYASRDDWSDADKAEFEKLDARAVALNAELSAFATAAAARSKARMAAEK